MKHRSIAKNALFGAITFALAQPALAVTDEEFNTLKEQFNQLADQVDENSQNTSDTTVGGYGELHYNNLSGPDGAEKKVLDLHRFVIFVNHEFNDDIRFFSEFEIEHAFVADNNDGSGKTAPGEIEVEQAYVQFDIGDNSKVDAGVFLIPVGILNETHEPPTFYGVERNPVEKNIIPVTWWEGGAMLSGNYDSGFSYDAALTSGLDGGTSIRGGRQKTGKASANNLAATGRVKYTGVSGLTLATTLQYQDDMTQDDTDDIGSATMIEAHARWNVADFTLTGLYAHWDIDVKNTASASDQAKDVQDGGYLEASYKLTPAWGVFVRQNEWDNGGLGDTSKSQTDVGVNFWPHENVVIKADYQAQNNIAGDFDGFNLGVGYQF
ncbi:MAG: porin [Proteobacteria bacterium]|nr:porin [Pseudomonadota bacterium]